MPVLALENLTIQGGREDVSNKRPCRASHHLFISFTTFVRSQWVPTFNSQYLYPFASIWPQAARATDCELRELEVLHQWLTCVGIHLVCSWRLTRSALTPAALSRTLAWFPSLPSSHLPTSSSWEHFLVVHLDTNSGSAFGGPNLRHVHINYGGVRFKMRSTLIEVLGKS